MEEFGTNRATNEEVAKRRKKGFANEQLITNGWRFLDADQFLQSPTNSRPTTHISGVKSWKYRASTPPHKRHTESERPANKRERPDVIVMGLIIPWFSHK